ncbi:MAG TPA: GspE/PulE family protein [Candidatus Baltobacteraceae bacterium]|nr:GspE/PulE family protein [Candidatus Baltobacteraceae bacterium]
MTLSQKLWVPIEPEVGLSHGRVDAARVEDTPIVRAVDEILNSAAAARASDVHIEPFAGGGRVRERVDGVLRESRLLSGEHFERVLSRLKLLAGMDIADRRLPQEGRYCTRLGGRYVEARVSSLPTVSGERLAIRMLEPQSDVPRFEELGMPAPMARRFRDFVHAPAGFIVVCGPTGSGKTTTLYSALAERNVVGQQLCSVEDPVEVRLPGVAQVQVNVRAGVTFAVALRSFLRQDPDVVMVGEMRDAETAAVASSAGLCGQLVMTTLHANDALHALDRLMELGLSARAIAASVSAVLSQRLLRQLCGDCKTSVTIGTEGEWLGIKAGSIAAAPRGCARCGGSGYWKRSAIFEIIAMTPELRSAIESRVPLEMRRAVVCSDGFETMQRWAARRVLDGETSVEEASRVLGAGR